MDKNNEVVYVGKAKNLKKRVASYFTKDASLLDKTRALVSKVEKIRIIPVDSEIESLLLEANLIKKYTPLYNVKLTDGKAYPLIRITRKDIYPKVLIARRPEDNPATLGSIYFGPYPNAGAMKMVLKIVRRIFPFESVLNHPKRKCLYFHLGLCPCGEAFDSEEVKQEYKRNIRHIVQFLNGETKKVVKELEVERNIWSQHEEFEKAQLIQYQIDAVKLVTSNVRSPFEYEMNPNLKSDLRDQELLELKEHLAKVGVKVDTLSRIECFDISNIQGHFATASMVVFVNGEKESSLYRRFRIRLKTEGKPNDFASMEEVITRRLKHKEWEYPGLLIVDGGKGQVSAALKALANSKTTLPLVGLAKREEEIIVSYTRSHLIKADKETPCQEVTGFREIKLPKSSKPLQLIQRIRDEAHRFAITYHRKLRSKNFLNKN